MRIGLAQINPTIGDHEGNAARILEFAGRAAREGADLVLFPELSINGYPPRDLLEVPAFVRQGTEALERLAARVRRPAVLVGVAVPNPEPSGRPLQNAAALLADGRVLAWRQKRLLPFYDVFDEERYFEPCRSNDPVELLGKRLGITICEDLWNVEGALQRRYRQPDPVAALVRAGAEILVNVSSLSLIHI